jgi:hypothetical protein
MRWLIMKTIKQITEELNFKEQRVTHWEKYGTVPKNREIQNNAGFTVNNYYEYDIDSRGLVNLKRLEVS